MVDTGKDRGGEIHRRVQGRDVEGRRDAGCQAERAGHQAHAGEPWHINVQVRPGPGQEFHGVRHGGPGRPGQAHARRLKAQERGPRRGHRAVANRPRHLRQQALLGQDRREVPRRPYARGHQPARRHQEVAARERHADRGAHRGGALEHGRLQDRVQLQAQGVLRGGRGVAVVPRSAHGLPQGNLRGFGHGQRERDHATHRNRRRRQQRLVQPRGRQAVHALLRLDDRCPVHLEEGRPARAGRGLGRLGAGEPAHRPGRGGAAELPAGEQGRHLQVRQGRCEDHPGVLQRVGWWRGRGRAPRRRLADPCRRRADPQGREAGRQRRRGGRGDVGRRQEEGDQALARREAPRRREPLHGGAPRAQQSPEVQRELGDHRPQQRDGYRRGDCVHQLRRLADALPPSHHHSQAQRARWDPSCWYSWEAPDKSLRTPVYVS
mmetsp:Transcript_50697/g.136103  ORF Transcript_50697/g.136103 Transcript_50697/m.136103 type:complete len:435 (-) Transcript_50697:57-1361(-)